MFLTVPEKIRRVEGKKTKTAVGVSSDRLPTECHELHYLLSQQLLNQREIVLRKQEREEE